MYPVPGPMEELNLRSDNMASKKRLELNEHQLMRLISACKTEIADREILIATPTTTPNDGFIRIMHIAIEDYKELITMLENKR